MLQIWAKVFAKPEETPCLLTPIVRRVSYQDKSTTKETNTRTLRQSVLLLLHQGIQLHEPVRS